MYLPGLKPADVLHEDHRRVARDDSWMELKTLESQSVSRSLVFLASRPILSRNPSSNSRLIHGIKLKKLSRVFSRLHAEASRFPRCSTATTLKTTDQDGKNLYFTTAGTFSKAGWKWVLVSIIEDSLKSFAQSMDHCVGQWGAWKRHSP